MCDNEVTAEPQNDACSGSRSRQSSLGRLSLDGCVVGMSNGGSSLSPLSPSSAFGRTCLARDGGAINMIVLSYWDNILGPKIKHVWTMDARCEPDADLLMHVATHTLSGEIYQCGLEAHVDTKFYSVARHDVTVAAFVFSAVEKGDTTVHSVSLVMPRHRRDTFLCWHGLCHTWMTRSIGKLRVMLAKVGQLTSLSSKLCFG